jgi:hypothetical protein
MSLVGRRLPTRVRNLNGDFQYIQDKQEVTLNVRFGVHIGPFGDFSDIQVWRSGMRSKPAVPWHPVYVSVAATVAVHAQSASRLQIGKYPCANDRHPINQPLFVKLLIVIICCFSPNRVLLAFQQKTIPLICPAAKVCCRKAHCIQEY